MRRQRQQKVSAGLMIVLAVMILAGGARIVTTTFLPPPTSQTDTALPDSTAFRRSVQIVTVSISVMATCFGWPAPASERSRHGASGRAARRPARDRR